MKTKGTCAKTSAALVACAIVLFAIVSVFSPASVCEANSAMRYFECRDASGAILTTQNSPVVIEREDLTFDIDFANRTSATQIGTVSAKYTFKNPSDATAKTNVVFPLGYFSEISKSEDDVSKFSVAINDEKTDNKVRYSYKQYGSKFSVENDLEYLKDEIVDDKLYKPDTTVYKYTYFCTVTNVWCRIFLGNDSQNIVFENGYRSYAQNLDGSEFIYFMATDEKFVFYSLEKDIDVAERAGFFSDFDKNTGVQGSLKLVDKQQITFEQLAYSYFDESFGVSKTDWFNAVLAKLKNENHVATGQDFKVRDDLFCWLEYDMTFEPNQTLVNEVVAPLYPGIDYSYSPAIYAFNYLVSPASTWKSFSNLNVRINTDYYLISASEDFEKVDGGYAWHSDSLPENEMWFSLSENENPTYNEDGYHFGNGKTVVNIILLTILEPLCITIAGIVIVVAIIESDKKKAKKRK